MHKKFLFLVDDGWRFDRRELLCYLKGKLDFDVATYDDLTYEALREEFRVTKLENRAPRGLFYVLTMFFARELDTDVARTVRKVRFHAAPFRKKIFQGLRHWAGLLGLRRYTYHAAFKFLYRKSDMYGDVLRGYDAVIFSPVHVLDKRIVYEARNRGLRIVCWVYSWDNPLKENEFIPDANRYLVWNRETHDLLCGMYGIPPDIIDVVGPVQFDYLLHRESPPRPARPPPRRPPAPDRYVLFTCSLGWFQFYIDQEIELIRMVRRLLDEIDPSMRLVVRPYPTAGAQEAYKTLESQDHIEVVSFGTYRRWGIIETTHRDLEEKYDQISRAACLISLGSTIALEASFTGTPIIQIHFNLPTGYAPWQDLMEVFKNEHLRLIIDRQFPNVVDSESALKQALADILAGRTEPYMDYTRKLQGFANPFDAPSFRSVFLKALQDLP